MPVRLPMSWGIHPGPRVPEQFEFVVREFVPRLGIQPTEAWYTTYGRRPQILTGAVAETLARNGAGAGDREMDAPSGPPLMTTSPTSIGTIVRPVGGFQM